MNQIVKFGQLTLHTFLAATLLERGVELNLKLWDAPLGILSGSWIANRTEAFSLMILSWKCSHSHHWFLVHTWKMLTAYAVYELCGSSRWSQSAHDRSGLYDLSAFHCAWVSIVDFASVLHFGSLIDMLLHGPDTLGTATLLVLSELFQSKVKTASLMSHLWSVMVCLSCHECYQMLLTYSYDKSLSWLCL